MYGTSTPANHREVRRSVPPSVSKENKVVKAYKGRHK